MKINSNVINLIIISIITQIIQVSPAYSNTYKEPEILKDDISQNYLTELHSQKYNYRLKEYQENLNTKFIKEQNHFKKQYQQKEYKDIDIHLTEEDMLFQKPRYTGQIDLSEGIPVFVTPLQTYTTNLLYTSNNGRLVIQETPMLGSLAKFRTTQDVYKDKILIIPKNTIITGMIGNVVMQESNGSPGELTIERFHYKDNNNKNIFLSGKIYNAGHMTGFIYQSIGGGLAPFSFGMSYPLLSTIPGTAAKIKVGKTYTIYYK